ncbi:hypothetical protein, partial [Paucibacter soli]|uniref:hypothetical protein n=1 Tax=Paucibacter soli TaxID=3133433 RepID=UPI0030AFD8CD
HHNHLMRRHIAFLHTSPVHVETFGRLIKAADPTLEVEHVVAEVLLTDAQRLGASAPSLVKRVQDAMVDAASNGAALVICTCSTIGGAAERTPTSAGFAAIRIDRAMADRAVALGPRILLVAALESTLGPTAELIHESAAALRSEVELELLLVAGAWSHFLQGDRTAYAEAVAAAVRAATSRASVVVLAQASMAPAVELLSDLDVEVLANPLLGVQSALAYLRCDA